MDEICGKLKKASGLFIVCTHVGKQHIHSHKHLAFIISNGKRFVRCDSHGVDYSEAAIMEHISGKRIVAPKARAAAQSKPNMLIDIQARMQNINSPGFKRWAKIFNFKEMAKLAITTCFI